LKPLQRLFWQTKACRLITAGRETRSFLLARKVIDDQRYKTDDKIIIWVLNKLLSWLYGRIICGFCEDPADLKLNGFLRVCL
jgi:hypothetical protein